MKKHTAVIEKIKTALIVLLVISALGLGSKTGLFNEFFKGSESFADLFSKVSGRRNLPLASNEASEGAGEAALPVFVAVTGAEGARFGEKYSQSNIQALYEHTGNTFSEAIGSAISEKEITEKQWQAALRVNGVFYDYLNALPLSSVSSWFGAAAESAPERTVRRLCIALDGQDVKLYYKDEAENKFYSCETAVRPASISAYSGEYPPNGARFAFEAGAEYSGADPYTLITTAQPEPPVLKSENPIGSSISSDNILSVFGINPYSSYTEKDGTQVFVETSYSLRISSGGIVEYNSVEETQLPVDYGTLESVVEYARGLVEATISLSCGTAKVYLSSVQQSGEKYVLYFSYFVDALPVQLYDVGWAAKMVLEKGSLTEAVLNFRSYSALEEKSRVLPADQATAGVKSGGEPLLSYVDTGAQSATADWIIG